MIGESEVSDEQIVQFLNDPPQASSSTGGNLVALVVSLLIFAGAGLFEWSIAELATLVLVIFLHEGGHLLAMKLFGYKDLRMLFLPFLGAIASGRTGTHLSYQQAIVSLAGPVPGIAIGLILLFAGLGTGIDWLFFAANLFLFLNLFNMLPIFPLDGGRFLDDLVFSRYFQVEMVTKILASVGIVLLAWFMDWWLLLVVLIGTLGSLRNSHLVNSTLTNMKRDPEYQPGPQTVASPAIVALIRRNIEPAVGDTFQNPSELASHVSSVWTRLSTVYPPIGVTILLLCVYGFCVILGLSVFVSGGGG